MEYGCWELFHTSHGRVRSLMACSKSELEKMIQTQGKLNAAVISFHDLADDGLETSKLSKVKKCLEIAVDDLAYYDLNDYGFTYETYFPEAKEIAQFVKDIADDDCDVICQCSYGQSRSAGCAAAILEYFEHKGIQIFADFRFCPNQLIYNRVHDALLEGEEEYVY